MENELRPEMRHVPPLSELIERVDVRLRGIVDILYGAAFDTEHEKDAETLKEVEEQFERVIVWMDRLCDYARHSKRQPKRDGSLLGRLHHELDSAVVALRTLDEKNFRRGNSFHSFDKSDSESIYSTVLALVDVTWRIGELIARFDESVFMKVYDAILEVRPPAMIEGGRPLGRTV